MITDDAGAIVMAPATSAGTDTGLVGGHSLGGVKACQLAATSAE